MAGSVRFEWNGATVKKKLEGATIAAMDDTNREAAEFVRSIIWVDTGEAFESVNYTPAVRQGRKIVGSFGSDGSAAHFIFIDQGTRFIHGGFFLARAADAILPTFPAKLQARAF